MRHLNKVCAIGLGLLASQALSAPCDDISIVVDTGTFTFDCTNNGTEADVAVFFSDVNVAQVIVANGTPISLLNVRSAGTPVTVIVRGATPAEDPTRLGGIQVPNVINAPPVFFELNINGNFDAGMVGATRLVNSTITGNVNAPVSLIKKGAVPGRLDNVFVGGDFNGPIFIEESGLPSAGVGDAVLQNLEVIGKLGTATSVIKVDGTIDGVEAGELNAPITDMAGGMDKVSIGSLRIVTTSGGAGDVNAAITCASGPTEFIVEGALKAPVTTGSGLGDTLPSVEYQFGLGGLQDQIIFGAVAPFTKTWLGEASVGGANLTNTPSYAEVSAALGHGAIGLVPFDLHDEDSAPVGGTNPQTLGNVVHVCHYGPVSFDASTGEQPIVFERRLKAGGVWETVSAGCHGTTIGDTNRDLRIGFGHNLPGGFEYRITPVMRGIAQLKSELGANDAPVTNYTYMFDIGSDCIEDINGDNLIDLADFNILLFNFGLSPGCPIQGDLNVDGAVDLNDLQLFLFKFGTTCGAASATGGGGGATATIAEACGFNHSEAYLAWRASLSPAELGDHLKDIPAILAGR